MNPHDIKIGKRFRSDYGDLAGLAESIKRYGLLSAITVSSDGELLAGGRRLEASKLAGLTDVPVRILDKLSERDQRLVELEENIRRKDLTWQEEVNLKAEIDRLLKLENPKHTQKETAEQYFGETAANFSRDLELAKAIEVFPDLSKLENKFQANRAYRKMKEDGQWLLVHAQQKVKPQQWKWADEHYKSGDTLVELGNVPAESFHFIECDPPYGLTHDDVKSANAQTIELTTENPEEFHLQLLEKLYSVAAPNSFLVLWHAMSHLSMIHRCLERTQWKFDTIPAIWLKPNATYNVNPDIKLSCKFEPFTVARKGIPTLAKPRSNVFEFNTVHSFDRIRHAEKPVELYNELLLTFVRPGMKLLCPFLGSGNFLIACYDSNMTAFGWDLDESMKPQFVERVKRRFTDASISKV